MHILCISSPLLSCYSDPQAGVNRNVLRLYSWTSAIWRRSILCTRTSGYSGSESLCYHAEGSWVRVPSRTRYTYQWGGGETGFPIGRVKKSTHLTASLCMFGIPNGHEEKEPSPECVTKIKNVCQSAVQENSVIYSYSTSCSTKDFLSILIGHLTRLFWNSLWNRFKLDLITNGGEQLNPEKFRYPC